jgi:hypothetical protein
MFASDMNGADEGNADAIAPSVEPNGAMISTETKKA